MLVNFFYLLNTTHMKSTTITFILNQIYFSRLRVTIPLFFCCFFTFVQSVSAEPVALHWDARPIKGKVTDENNQPLIAATVQIKNSTKGALTDLSGNFQIDAETNDILVFSYLGYESQEITVGNNNDIYLVMKPSNAQLDQVVVVAYGTQKKRSVTGAISTVKGDQISKQPLLTAVQGIQGMVPGIQVSGTSQPGTQPRVTIRGLNTILTNENPLYVVDGTPTDDITNINTADIVSVDVLKDGSAAMYGSRSANGVILITTRKGQSGKPNVSVDMYTGYRKLTNIVDMADRGQYLAYTNEARAYDAVDPLTTLDGTANTDWFKEISRNGALRNLNVNVNGGSDAFSYLFSAGYLQDQGVLKGADYGRLTLRSNNEYHVSKHFNIGNTLTASIIDSENKSNGTFTDAYRASPAAPINYPDSAGISQYGYQPGLSAAGNPVANLELTNDHGKALRLQGSLYGDVQLIKGLKFRSSLGFDRNNFGQRIYDPIYSYGTFTKSVSELRMIQGNKKYWVWNNTLSLNKQIGENHGIDVVLGTSSEETNGRDNVLRVANVPNQENLWYLSKGDPSSLSLLRDNGFLIRQNSLFGRANYSLMNKYNLSAVVRRDGSSAFPKDRKFGTFYSVGTSWIISDEKFFKNSLFETMKLRLGYAKLGNDAIGRITNFDQSRLINNDLSALLSVTNTSPYAFPGSLVDGITFDQIKDASASWEETKSLDAGVEFGMFGNKLQGEISYYNKLTQAYIRVPTPIFVDKDGILSQAADVRNKGIEAALNYRKFENESFSWRLGINSTWNNNNVEKVRGGINLKEGGLGNGEVTTSTVEGQPIGSFWVYETDGIFQSADEITNAPHIEGALPGDFKYKDINGDKLIDERDRIYAGSYQAKFYYGLNGGFNFKALDLSVDCYGNAGNKVYNGKKAVRFGNENIEAVRDKRWKPGASGATEYRASNSIPKPSTYFVESGSFFRINNVTLGYTLPSSIFEKANIARTRIYVSAQNPVISKKFSGFSPELPGANALNSGIELYVYPVTATYMVGVNFNFK
jgi:TonB-dependent starch-binding outer membrane protein SusC